MDHTFFKVDAPTIFSNIESSIVLYNMYKVAFSFDHVFFNVLFCASEYHVVFSPSSKPSCTTYQASSNPRRAFIWMLQLS